MDGEIAIGVPSTAGRWRFLADQHEVKSTSIQDLKTFNSASKIKEAQFLALHVLWKSYAPDEIDLEKEYDIKYRAEDLKDLAWNKHWGPYVQEISKGFDGKTDLGTFDLLYDFQREIENSTLGPQETKKVFFNVTTRLQRKAAGGNNSPPSTPSRAPRSPNPGSDDLEVGSLENEIKELHIDDMSSVGSPQSLGVRSVIEPISPVTSDEAKWLPLVKDEQIVNTALILLLRGLCMRMPGFTNARWSLERKAFRIRQHKSLDKECLYEARTDGHLAFFTENAPRSLAILEVKSQVRKDAEPWMQESAQMAAWIYDEPSTGDRSNFRRCMISQDRHEIYIIIATYTKEYVAYLQGDWDGSSGPFLTMHQIGPFIPNAERHMERLGRIIAALSRQLVHQAKNGNPCHW
ncbi:conserved hypothetical protein [Histoplasma capsulatum G186AR]|uniref:Uncharacterized protein n=2 Tax=Ajellomyces capsulatus TaxID=5037 RepID=C0NCK8_AJECG|nr:uncharacterized protein HCBG_00854 [Histoplasma capsulatum G186AR]EEH11399.1 conserved hypothetical protein [Histoplasma capsulatum G186AR]KAG5302757.1 hypothetical protein I7I52_00496 [Histoplasma capsulatum]QSS71842.1 hypothetical protein I7I50_02838 [Histoplasma capsulatum G186AR]